MNGADMSPAGPDGVGRALDFLYRHRSALVWLAIVTVVVWLQWTTIKGTFYRFLKAPAPADGVAWQADFQAGLAESKQTGRPVLLDFSASWCPPCQVMKHEVWPDTQVRQAIMAGYIPVLLDIDTPASQEVAQRYNVRSVPTILILAADGRIVRQAGFMSRSAMLAFLKSPG
jgi:thiol:disulfide interchange protein